MSVSPEAVTISDTKSGDAMGWRLETLKRFYMKNDKCDILVIESGAYVHYEYVNLHFSMYI